MTVYELKNFDKNNYFTKKDLVDCALWTAFDIVIGKTYYSDKPYCRKTICKWPIKKEEFYKYSFAKSLRKKYISYENYKNSKDYVVKYEEDDDSGMGALYYLLDNFNSYYGIFKYTHYLIILSVGVSYTNTGDGYDINKLPDGFAVIIDIITNNISLIPLGEDDGNYWAESEIPYNNLCIYDRGMICSIVNNICLSDFSNKNELIYKLIYNQFKICRNIVEFKIK